MRGKRLKKRTVVEKSDEYMVGVGSFRSNLNIVSRFDLRY